MEKYAVTEERWTQRRVSAHVLHHTCRQLVIKVLNFLLISFKFQTLKERAYSVFKKVSMGKTQKELYALKVGRMFESTDSITFSM